MAVDGYEVRFRGRKVAEGGEKHLDTSLCELRAWKPTSGKSFLCNEETARRRFDELVLEGVANREVDRVIPFVIEICAVTFSAHEGEEVVFRETMLWQYAEVGAIQEGPWAPTFEPSGHSVSVN